MTRHSTIRSSEVDAVRLDAPGAAGGAVRCAVGGRGIVVIPLDGFGARRIPELVSWSEVAGFGADATVDLDDRGTLQVLEIVLDDASRIGLALPAAEASTFFAGVRANADAWRDARGVGPGTRARSITLAPTRALAELTERVRAALVRPRQRIAVALACVLGLGLLGGTSATVQASVGGARPGPSVQVGNYALSHLMADGALTGYALPKATSAPVPLAPSLSGSPTLRPHEVFGYAPYWTLPESGGFDVKDLTTLAYFSVDVNGDGTIAQSGSGWNGYQSQDLVNLVDRAHAAGDRVVLTVTCFSQGALDAITSSPTSAGTLSAQLIQLVSAKQLDGVNFDFEGEGNADQAGLTSLLTSVSHALHAANPHWQVTMATYASAAADPGGFYDIPALAPAMDGFFVMAYDMNDRSVPSPTAPLVGGSFSDLEALQEYTAAVPPSKVILGVPFYGYDWPTTDGALGAAAMGGESPLSYGVIAAGGNPDYWDPTTQTAWTSYEVGAQWHETFYDDPSSLALKAQLADHFQIAGLGIWALGMDGNDPAMMAALLGHAPAVKDLSTGPTQTSQSAPVPTTTTQPGAPPPPVGVGGGGPPVSVAPSLPGAGATTTAMWQGTRVTLSPEPVPTFGGSGAAVLGTISGLTSTDPALSCLATGPSLQVWQFPSEPGVDVVIATTPTDCMTAAFTFPDPGTAPPPTTTTTTAPPTTTTTTTTAPPTTTTTTPSGSTPLNGSSTTTTG